MKVNWTKVKYTLLAVLHPGTWFRVRCDSDWDKKLWDMIDQGEIEYVGTFQAIIGGHKVWIANYPYASGSDECAIPKQLCSAATALYLESQLDSARIMQRLRGLEKPNWYYKSKDGRMILS